MSKKAIRLNALQKMKTTRSVDRPDLRRNLWKSLF